MSEHKAYDFDTIINRRGTGSVKWDLVGRCLPMWVADMDFQTAPEIRQALSQRIDHGIFGYEIIPDAWYDAYISFWKTRHHFEVERDWLVFASGVVPIISSAVRKLATPNENVLLMTPVYNAFFSSVENNGCRVLPSPLRYEDGQYSIDWRDLEKKLADPQTSLMILCNPQNPEGKIWDRKTLRHIGDLCARHHVIVISDEIHCDITQPGKEYIPFASVSETCRDISITCWSPTKCFNMAGLHTAAACVPNEYLRHKIWRAVNTDELGEPNSFAVTAAVAALTEGGPWLDALRQYLWDNRLYAEAFIRQEIPEIYVVPAEATYLMWLDCSGLNDRQNWSPKPIGDDLAAFLRKKALLALTPGSTYGKEGNSFMRLNYACPRKTLEEGLRRLSDGVALFRQQ